MVPCGDWGEAHEDAEPLCLWKLQGFSGHRMLKHSLPRINGASRASQQRSIRVRVGSRTNACRFRDYLLDSVVQGRDSSQFLVGPTA